MLQQISLGIDTSGRALIVDDRTLAKLREAERRLGRALTIVQGSYRGGFGAAASAGTHDRGGVIDIRTWDLGDVTPQRVVRVLRECGFVAWYRTRAQGFDPHIHAIDYGNPALAPAAQGQVKAWEQGYNGLASYGRDDGPRVTIPQDPPPASEEILDMDEKDLTRIIRQAVRDELDNVRLDDRDQPKVNRSVSGLLLEIDRRLGNLERANRGEN